MYGPFLDMLTFFYVGLECERGVLYKTHLFVAVGSLAR